VQRQIHLVEERLALTSYRADALIFGAWGSC
jgi:hypothetical protein